MTAGQKGISWSRIISEFVVIVFGVLTALAADGWNDARLQRIEEAEYLKRLQADVQHDTAQHGYIIEFMDQKETSLRRLNALLTAQTFSEADTASLLLHLANASNFGWNVGPLARRATYEDLRSSGKLGLIRDPELRGDVINYQSRAEAQDRRIQARRTQYPHIAYRLVPSSRAAAPNDFGSSELAEAQDLESLLATLRGSELRYHVLAEINRTLFIRNVVEELRGDAVHLLGELPSNPSR